MDNYVEEYNVNQVRAESLKYTSNQHKQEIARLTEELTLIKSSVVYFQVEAKNITSEKNIAVFKVQKMKG